MQVVVTWIDFEKHKVWFACGSRLFQPLESLFFLTRFGVYGSGVSRRNPLSLRDRFLYPFQVLTAVFQDHVARISSGVRLDLFFRRTVLLHLLSDGLHRLLIHSFVN